MSREDLARRCETSEQHDHMLMILREALGATELPQKVLDAAVKSRDIIQFGILVRGILGPEVELAQWNQEAIRHGEAAITNPSCDEQFQNHRSRMLPVLRRIVAALAVHTPEAPSYTEMMTRLDDMRPSPDSAQAYWELPALEVAGAIVAELAGAGFELDETTLRDLLASDEPGRAISCIPFEVPQTDPVETASENRRLLESLHSRFMLIAATWHAATDQNKGSAWREAKLGDPTTSPRPEDRDVFTVRWDEARVLEFLRADLPATAPQKVRDALRDAESLDVLMMALQVDASEMEDAQKRLSAQQVADERKKRMVSVCGEEIENSESGLADLFTHISMHLPDAGVCANDGFDLSAVTLPQKVKKLKKGKNIGRTRRTRAPGKMRRNMEDLIGAAGEIHAFRWLQLRYGKDVVTPANWVSAYSAKAFPDNASCVDEGKGCDIVFTLDGCTYHIEVKSSEDDNNGFTLGSSEIQLAREIAQNRRNRRREKYFVLKVNQALTSEPQFTLLPNPYDPAYKDRFDIVEEGARVTFRP